MTPVAINWSFLIGFGALLAGLGSLLSGLAAYHLAKKNGKEGSRTVEAIAPYAKAVTAAIVAALGAVAAALDDGSISSQEGVTIAIAFFVALGAVWAIPNKQQP